IVLVKKKNWWGDKLADKYPLLKANPDKIIYKIVRDINAAISLAKNGELDVIGKIPWSTFVPLKEDKLISEKFNFHTPQKIAYRYIALNNNNPKLADKRVRQALDYLFSREEIYETVYFGSKTPTIGPIHPTKPYYNKNLSVRSFDVSKAKSLLKEAGWTDSDGNGIVDKVIDGEKVEMNIDLLYANGYEDYAGISAIFKSNAIKAGVNITPKTLDSQVFVKTRNARDFDALIAASDWYPLHKDLANRFHTRGSQNYSSFSNEEADALIKEIRGTIDETKLPAGYLRMQEIIHDEVPSIFINTGNDRLIVSKKFKNVRVTAVKPHFYLNEFSQEVPVTINSQNN
ncbi:MAG: ABC transporter substrate-binding protein, partial [Saprospiraceae bacterium]